MGELTPDQKRLIFRIINEKASILAQAIAEHKPFDAGAEDPVKTAMALNEIIEIIGPDGEDMVPTVDPAIRRFSSQAMLEGKCQP